MARVTRPQRTLRVPVNASRSCKASRPLCARSRAPANRNTEAASSTSCRRAAVRTSRTLPSPRGCAGVRTPSPWSPCASYPPPGSRSLLRSDEKMASVPTAGNRGHERMARECGMPDATSNASRDQRGPEPAHTASTPSLQERRAVARSVGFVSPELCRAGRSGPNACRAAAEKGAPAPTPTPTSRRAACCAVARPGASVNVTLCAGLRLPWARNPCAAGCCRCAFTASSMRC